MKAFHYCLLLIAALFSSQTEAQTYAQMKVWDSHERHPKIWEIEFVGADETIATYDAIYGHGAMMENESYALRVYMDHRQSIDLYGKRHKEPELAVTDFYTTPEQTAEGYGEDILYVGGSVGAGSLRGWNGTEPVYIEHVRARGQRVLDVGPDSAVVEVWDKDWTLSSGETVQMLQRYTMRSGERATQIDVWLQGCTDETLFATGVQKLEQNNEGIMAPAQGLVASWGTNEPEKGEKPGVMETLGLAVLVPDEYLSAQLEDELNYLCILHPVDGHIRYYLFVAPDMEQDGGFHSAAGWFEWLTATRLHYPGPSE